MNRMILTVVSSGIVCLGVLAGWLAGMSPADESKPESIVNLPKPPERSPDASKQAQKCIECHAEIADLLEGDKHIADDFHCVVCHGESKAHIEAEVEGALPDRTWRRWVEKENRYEWRMKHASLEIARYCASCHGRKARNGHQIKTINWTAYLDTGHGRGVSKDHRDAPTCTDCHYAHGAGCEPLTDDTVVERCSVCHGDKEMMKRVDLDPDVMDDFKAGTHGDMDSVPAANRSSCIKCHYPH